MKKLYSLTLCIFLIQPGVQAQTLPNSDFENWTPSGSPAPFNWEEPTTWKSINAQTEWTLAGVIKTSDSYSGSFACKLVSVPISFGWPSVLCNGDPITSGDPFSNPGLDIITGGTPISTKPNKVRGFYKFDNNNPLDSGYAKVILKKYNTALNKIDTIGIGEFHFQEVAVFTQFEIMINDIAPLITPDSIVMAFYSTDPDNPLPHNPGSAGLIIDSISLVFGAAAIEDKEKIGFNAIVYPNPAKDFLIVQGPKMTDYSIQLYNGKGQKLKSVIGKGDVKMDVSDLSKGAYNIKIESLDKLHSVVRSIVIE